MGNYPEVVLAGRRINDGMGRWAASPRTTCSPTPKPAATLSPASARRSLTSSL